MATNSFLILMLAGGAGILLGLIFFGGLWWTVQKGLASKYAALWFLTSLLLRSAISLGGFYLVGNDDPIRLLACLGGFVLARFIVTKLTSRTVVPDPVETRTRHEP
jgi:F1F0 ATPase subunit 2